MNAAMSNKQMGPSATSRTMDRRAMMKYLARPPVIPITNQRARFEDRQMQYFFDKRMQEVTERYGKDKHIVACPPSTGERIHKSSTPFSEVMKEAEERFEKESTH
ncbi:hypothetical protein BLSTO_02281 [Blastocystis sp. subtype 1]